MLIQMQYTKNNNTGKVYSSAVQTQSDIIASHYNHSFLSITM